MASSERTIVPTVDGFACGPWRGTLPMTLYGAPTKTRRARPPDLGAPERDEIADQRADEQPDKGKPPVRDDRAPVAAEIDFLLGFPVTSGVLKVRRL